MQNAQSNRFDLFWQLCECWKVTLARYPSAAMLVGLLAAVVPLLTATPGGLWFTPLLLFPAAMAGKKTVFRLLLGFVAGLLCLVGKSSFSPDDYTHFTGLKNCGAEIEAEITDAACVGPQHPWLANPKLITIQLRKFRFSSSDQWQCVSGQTMIRLPDDAPPVAYGDLLRLQGAFLLPDQALQFFRFDPSSGNFLATPEALASGFNFKTYLSAQDIAMTFNADKMELLAGKNNSFSRGVMSLRNSILGFLVADMKNVEAKRITAALLFGCRQGLSWEDRQSFIRTGTIHALTVSGFHIAILALVIFWLLRPIPFRYRNFLVPLLVFFYVLTTGMNPPAVRSLIMISVWTFSRGMLYKTPGLNNVFLSAVLILLLNPFYLRDAGFQYSFIVVGFLIASTGSIREWTALAGEKLQWVPGSLRNSFFLTSRVGIPLLATLLSCLIAALVSSGITVFYQGFYCPQTVLLNFLIIPAVWLIFLFAVLKILLLPLLFLGGIFTGAMELSVDFMCGICSMFDRYLPIQSIPMPTVWTLAVFYLAVTLLLLASRPKIFYAALALLLLVIGFWHWEGMNEPGRITIFSGSRGDVPALVVTRPGGLGCTVVDIPDRSVARDIINYLRSNGINRIDSVIVSSAVKANAGGLETLLQTIPVREVIMPAGRSNATAMIVAADVASRNADCTFSVAGSNNSVTYSTADLKITCENGIMTLDYVRHDQGAKIVYQLNPESDDSLQFTREKRSYQFNLSRSSNRIVREFVLP